MEPTGSLFCRGKSLEFWIDRGYPAVLYRTYDVNGGYAMVAPEGAVATATGLLGPTSVAVDRDGNLFFTEKDWHEVGGCESAWVAFDPDRPRFV